MFLPVLPFFKRVLIVGVIVALSLVAAVVIYAVAGVQYQTTLLFSVGVAEDSSVEKNLPVTQFAHDFSQTIVGWLKSPTFSQRVGELAEARVDVSGKAQARQNFLLSVTTQQAAVLPQAREAATQVLEEEITKYNVRSFAKFFVNEQGVSERVLRPNLFLAILGSVLGGLFLGFLVILGLNYFSGYVNSRQEIERILGANGFYLGGLAEAELNFCQALRKKLKGKGLLVVAADFQPGKRLAKVFPDMVIFPQGAEKVLKNQGELIVLTKIDVTRVATLEKLKGVLTEPFTLIILG